MALRALFQSAAGIQLDYKRDSTASLSAPCRSYILRRAVLAVYQVNKTRIPSRLLAIIVQASRAPSGDRLQHRLQLLRR